MVVGTFLMFRIQESAIKNSFWVQFLQQRVGVSSSISITMFSTFATVRVLFLTQNHELLLLLLRWRSRNIICAHKFSQLPSKSSKPESFTFNPPFATLTPPGDNSSILRLPSVNRRRNNLNVLVPYKMHCRFNAFHMPDSYPGLISEFTCRCKNSRPDKSSTCAQTVAKSDQVSTMSQTVLGCGRFDCYPVS